MLHRTAAAFIPTAAAGMRVGLSPHRHHALSLRTRRGDDSRSTAAAAATTTAVFLMPADVMAAARRAAASLRIGAVDVNKAKPRKKTTPTTTTTTPTTMSLLPLVPNWLLLAAWIFGAYRFYLGFNKTSYQSSFRIPLALAWPVLIIVNGSYRQNFVRSIRAADDD